MDNSETEIETTPTSTAPVEQAQEVALTMPHEDGELLLGTDGPERIVYDKDESGSVIGWHKEAV